MDRRNVNFSTVRLKTNDIQSAHSILYVKIVVFVPEYVSAGGYPDPYQVQRQQYQYYEHLRRSNPAAYMQVYKQLLAGHAPPVPLDYRAPLYDGEGLTFISNGSLHDFSKSGCTTTKVTKQTTVGLSYEEDLSCRGSTAVTIKMLS